MSELAYRTLRENVTAEIRAKILNEELAPGTRIVEQNLSKEFGISRGPIREAFLSCISCGPTMRSWRYVCVTAGSQSRSCRKWRGSWRPCARSGTGRCTG